MTPPENFCVLSDSIDLFLALHGLKTAFQISDVCAKPVWMNINRHINRLISLEWWHGIILLYREREEGAAGRSGDVSSASQVAMLILSHQPAEGRQSSSYPEAPVKKVNLSPLHLWVHFSQSITAQDWLQLIPAMNRDEMMIKALANFTKIYAYQEEVLKPPALTNRAISFKNISFQDTTFSDPLSLQFEIFWISQGPSDGQPIAKQSRSAGTAADRLLLLRQKHGVFFLE